MYIIIIIMAKKSKDENDLDAWGFGSSSSKLEEKIDRLERVMQGIASTMDENYVRTNALLHDLDQRLDRVEQASRIPTSSRPPLYKLPPR